MSNTVRVSNFLPPVGSRLVQVQARMTPAWTAWADEVARSLKRFMRVEVNVTVPTIGGGGVYQITVTVPGAVPGSPAVSTLNPTNSALITYSQVTAANTVTVTIQNVSASPVTLGASALSLMVFLVE